MAQHVENSDEALLFSKDSIKIYILIGNSLGNKNFREIKYYNALIDVEFKNLAPK